MAKNEDALNGFSEMSRVILRLAEREAAFFQHAQVRPEHIVLAIAAVPEAVGSRLLRRHRIDPQEVVRKIVGHFHIDRTTRAPATISLAPDTLEVLRAARAEAAGFRAEYVGTECLLLAIVTRPEGLAGRILAGYGLDADELRSQVADVHAGSRQVRPDTAVHGTSAEAAAGSPPAAAFPKTGVPDVDAAGGEAKEKENGP